MSEPIATKVWREGDPGAFEEGAPHAFAVLLKHAAREALARGANRR
jgi:hypothetical protein